MRLSLEPLLYQAGVDIVFNGHGILPPFLLLIALYCMAQDLT